MTTTVFNPVLDGYVTSQNASYGTAWGSGGTKAVDSAGASILVGQRLSAGVYYLYEAFLSFDTSILGAGQYVATAYLEIYVSTHAMGEESDLHVIPLDFGDTLETADWVASANDSADLEWKSTSGIVNGAYFDVSYSSGHYYLAPGVNPTGRTRLMLLTRSGTSGTGFGYSPSGDEYITFNSAEAASNKPKLTVIHYTKVAPTVASDTPSAVGSSYATAGATLTAWGYDAVTEIGVCWNKTGTPTTADSKLVLATTNINNGNHYSGAIGPLDVDTTYHVRAYAINAQGTSYGLENDLTTIHPTALGGIASQQAVGTPVLGSGLLSVVPARPLPTFRPELINVGVGPLSGTTPAVANPTLDITALVEGLVWDKTSRGGLGGASFYMRDPDAIHGGLPNQIADGYGIWIRYGHKRHYEGWLLPPQELHTEDKRWYCPAGSYIDRGKRSEGFARVYKDSDIAQWYSAPDPPTWTKVMMQEFKIRILNPAGSVTPAADNGVKKVLAIYWLLAGLRTDIHVDSVTFTFTKVGTPAFTLGIGSWTVPPMPANAPTSEVTYTSATVDGAKTVTIATSAQAVCIYAQSVDAAGRTCTVDNGYDLTSIAIATSGAAGTNDIAVAMGDIALLAGATSALDTYAETVSTLAARPWTTLSGAQDGFASIASKQLVWGYEVGGLFDTKQAAAPDPNSKWDRAHWWTLCHSDTTFTSDVVTDGDRFYDVVGVMYGALGVSGITDGTTLIVYRNKNGAVTTPSNTDRVKILNFASRYMATSEAQSIGDQFMLWQGAGVAGVGTETIYGDVRDVDGHVRSALNIEPGDWVDERDRIGHRPWQVTAVHYDALGVVQASVGGVERAFPVIAPGIGALPESDVLGTYTPDSSSETGGAGTNPLDPSGQLTDEYLATHPWMATAGNGLGDYWNTHGATQYYLGANGVSYNTPEEATASWMQP